MQPELPEGMSWLTGEVQPLAITAGDRRFDCVVDKFTAWSAARRAEVVDVPATAQSSPLDEDR